MKRKNATVECFWTPAGSDCFVSITKRETYSYEKDFEILHQIYGGGLEYQSQTGMTGNGYLDFSKHPNDLIKIGSYRIERKSEEYQWKVTCDPTDADGDIKNPFLNGSLQVFIPLDKYGKITPWSERDKKVTRWPVVVTDGYHEIMFLDVQDEVHYILNYKNLEAIQWVDKTTEFVTIDGDMKKYEWKFYNPTHRNGVNSLKFLSVTKFVTADEEEWEETGVSSPPKVTVDLEYAPLMMKNLNLHRILNNRSGETYFLSKAGMYWGTQYYDGIFTEKDLKDPEVIINGFNYNQKGGYYYTRRNNSVYVFKEVERSSIENGHYAINNENYWGDGSPYVEFELEMDVVEFHFILSPEEIARSLDRGIRLKVKKDYVNFRLWENRETTELEILNQFKMNPDVIVTFEDSIESGNCEFGTSDFIEKYQLDKGGERIGMLMKHPKWDNEMSKNKFLFKAMMMSLERNDV